MSENLPRSGDVRPNTSLAADRRREPRFPTNVRVEVEIQQPPDVIRIQGTILDVSPSGLRLELPASVEAGTRVRINLKQVVISGEIRHCRPAKMGFNAGVSFNEVSGPEIFDQLDDGELDLYAIVVQIVHPSQ